MTTKNMAYDNPAYVARLAHAFGQNAAGASTAFSKFVAFTGLTIFSIVATQITAGSSTYTAWNGTSTITNINGDSFSAIVVRNSAAMGATPALTTSTYGPYTLGLYNGTATGTQTTVAGAGVYVALGTATGAAAPAVNGGFTVNQGDTVHIVRGTDATAVAAYAIEYGVSPLSNVTL